MFLYFIFKNKNKFKVIKICNTLKLVPKFVLKFNVKSREKFQRKHPEEESDRHNVRRTITLLSSTA